MVVLNIIELILQLQGQNLRNNMEGKNLMQILIVMKMEDRDGKLLSKCMIRMTGR